MRQRTKLILTLLLSMVHPVSAGQKPAELYFGGHRLTLGMRVSEVAAATSACCNFSPPLTAVETGDAGHFITTKESTPNQIIGTVWFTGGRVSRISRPIDTEFDGYNENVVRFARALRLALASTGDSSSPMLLSVKHSRATNGGADTISLSFPNGRGIELSVITLDNPLEGTSKRDAVTLEETLESPR